MNPRQWRDAWQAAKARRLLEGERLAAVDRDIDARQQAARQASMARHPSRLTAPVALPPGLREAAGRVLVRDAWRLEQAELVRAGIDEKPAPEVPALPVFSPRYPDDFTLPTAWVHTSWDDAWLTACQKGGAW